METGQEKLPGFSPGTPPVSGVVHGGGSGSGSGTADGLGGGVAGDAADRGEEHAAGNAAEHDSARQQFSLNPKAAAFKPRRLASGGDAATEAVSDPEAAAPGKLQNGVVAVETGEGEEQHAESLPNGTSDPMANDPSDGGAEGGAAE